MARIIAGAASFALPADADVEALTAAVIAAMGERTGLAVAVRGGDGRALRLIVNCAVAETVLIDLGPDGGGPATGDGEPGPKGGRISGLAPGGGPDLGEDDVASDDGPGVGPVPKGGRISG